ncbi:MAG: hypothetical protein ABI175_28765, partial [Polyangiales bacterium]
MSVDEMRTAFRAIRCHYLAVPGVFAEPAARKLRADVDAAPFIVFDEPDRGRYEATSDLAIPSVFDELRALAEQIVERTLKLERAVWQRLRHRDYLLMKGDAKSRLATANVEVTLDFSAAATAQAELVYTDGHESWVVLQDPGSVTVVEREPWLYRYDRYLNTAVGDKVVHRLRL